MGVVQDTVPPEKFRELTERISKYVDFRGCRTEECIEEKIRRRNSTKLNGLLKAGFPLRLLIESLINPHPVYKEILGIDEQEYNELVEEKRRSEKNLIEIMNYIK